MENNNLVIISIIAIVAIVAMVFMATGNNTQKYATSDSDYIISDEEGDLAGQAIRRNLVEVSKIDENILYATGTCNCHHENHDWVVYNTNEETCSRGCILSGAESSSWIPN